MPTSTTARAAVTRTPPNLSSGHPPLGPSAAGARYVSTPDRGDHARVTARGLNLPEQPEPPGEDAGFAEGFLLGQAEQVLDEAICLVVDGEVLLVGTDLLLAPPPQTVHRV